MAPGKVRFPIQIFLDYAYSGEERHGWAGTCSRFGEGPIAVPFASQAEPRSRRLELVTEGEHDEASTQLASVVRRELTLQLTRVWLQRSNLTLRVMPWKVVHSRCLFRISALQEWKC